MSSRAFLFISPIFSLVVVFTRQPVSGTLVKAKATPTATLLPPTVTSTATPTSDPFGQLPIATPLSGAGWTVACSLPTRNLSHTRKGGNQL